MLSNLHHINTKKEHIERIQEIKGIELDFIYYPIIINKKGEQFSMGFVYSKEEIKRKLYCILKNGKISFDTFKCIKIMYEDYPSVYDFNNFLKYLEIENIKLSEEELFYILSDFKK